MKPTWIIALILACLLGYGDTFAQKTSDVLRPDLGRKLSACPVCGMDVFERMLSRVDLAEGDSVLHACALGCASVLIKQDKNVKVEVYDYETGTMTPAFEAYFIFGSRVVPARAMLPALSFSTKEVAERFQRLHGGSIYRGAPAFELAAQIRAERMNGKIDPAKQSHE
jgi:hypothetical protein